jgi:hypothetical protein
VQGVKNNLQSSLGDNLFIGENFKRHEVYSAFKILDHLREREREGGRERERARTRERVCERGREGGSERDWITCCFGVLCCIGCVTLHAFIKMRS